MSRKTKPNKRKAYRTPVEIKEQALTESRFKGFEGMGVPSFTSSVEPDIPPVKVAKSVTRHARNPSADVEPIQTVSVRRVAAKARLPETNALLLTSADLCALLSISKRTLVRMEQAGEIPGRVMLGRSVRYHRETVETWLRGLLNDK